MTLFSHFARRIPRNGTAPVVVIDRRSPRLPPYFRRLREAICRNHVLPVQMHFAHFGDSADGQRVAIYECAVQGCRCRQAWAQHRVTGKAFRLWVRYD